MCVCVQAVRINAIRMKGLPKPGDTYGSGRVGHWRRACAVDNSVVVTAVIGGASGPGELET